MPRSKGRTISIFIFFGTFLGASTQLCTTNERTVIKDIKGSISVSGKNTNHDDPCFWTFIPTIENYEVVISVHSSGNPELKLSDGESVDRSCTTENTQCRHSGGCFWWFEKCEDVNGNIERCWPCSRLTSDDIGIQVASVASEAVFTRTEGSPTDSSQHVPDTRESFSQGRSSDEKEDQKTRRIATIVAPLLAVVILILVAVLVIVVVRRRAQRDSNAVDDGKVEVSNVLYESYPGSGERQEVDNVLYGNTS